MDIGFKIKQLREQNNISQEDLAYELEVTQSYLSKIENGQIEKLDFLFMQKICNYFKVDSRYFLDDHIVQNNTDNNNNSAVGNIYSSVTINNQIPAEVVENMTQLYKLIENLLKKQ
ncbi:MAG: helix-turn-helix transcriptional regulator [Bergeyella sp.]